jgi:hypothetical protein
MKEISITRVSSIGGKLQWLVMEFLFSFHVGCMRYFIVANHHDRPIVNRWPNRSGSVVGPLCFAETGSTKIKRNSFALETNHKTLMAYRRCPKGGEKVGASFPRPLTWSGLDVARGCIQIWGAISCLPHRLPPALPIGPPRSSEHVFLADSWDLHALMRIEGT